MTTPSQFENCGKSIHDRHLRDMASLVYAKARAVGNRSLDQYRKYVIFSTPRVGSSLLGKQLEQTGQLGKPEEWFSSDLISTFLSLTASKSMDIREYADWIIRGTASPTNIFGVNIHIHQYHHLKNNGIDLLDLKFDKIYYLQRRDKVKQAYSWAKAFKTQCWNKAIEKEAGFPDGIPVEISPLEVAEFLTNICKDRKYYEDNIKQRIKLDREFFYLDIIADDCHEAMNSILNDFGLPEARKKMKMQLSRQTNEIDAQRIIEIKQFFGLAV